ncbi:VOC family protein [Pseudonocardia sp. NPDC049154]|uniref:VOC family protein n=1 Tax=Pseudonocardia sp. NPDC049154 TaxID=3155501 RepID=UPI00340BEBF3
MTAADQRPASGAPSASLPASLQARFDHVAVAGPRIRDLLPIYRDLLGGRSAGGGDNPRVGYRALQLGYPDDRRVELMEPLPGSTFFDRFFARTGGGGMHHMTFLVPDVREAIREVEAAGWTPTSIFLENPVWQEVFLHPKETGGTLVQIVQAEKRDGPGATVEEILAGRGTWGTGTPSP